MNEDGDEGLEVGRITITRILDEDGDTVRVEPSEGLSMVEALGMIELSKDTLITTRMFSYMPDFDDEDGDDGED